MKTLSMLFLALSLAASASYVSAAPMIGFVDNFDGSVTLQVIPSGTGSIGAEIAATVTVSNTVTITDVELADPSIFDVELPGNNPFTGGVTVGLYENGNDIFASYGSIVFTDADPVDFLTLSYTGMGEIEAFGLLGEGGQLFENLSTSIVVSDATQNNIPEPNSLFLVAAATLFGAARRTRAA